jgi:glycosyltransferase involved in cell wall biosynthesis
MKSPLVTVVIPAKNSGAMLGNCLKSITKQTYTQIEIIIVDGHSTDNTTALAKKYHAKLYHFVPNVAAGTFDAPHKRNYGVSKASGSFVYYVDADMELTPTVIEEAVALCNQGAAAVILPEDSFGEGIWAQAKNLERRCYWGDDTVEAPRFFKKEVWIELGGLDEALGGGGDDWDLYQKLKDGGYQVARTKSMVMHNEGKLSLIKLCKKRFMYGRDSAQYIQKRPKAGLMSYFPIRLAYIRNWRLFVARPVDSIAFIVMRSAEYLAGFAGVIYTMLRFKK